MYLLHTRAEGLIAIIYHEAGFAGFSGGFQISAAFSMISAGMCLRHIQGRAAHSSRSCLPSGLLTGQSFSNRMKPQTFNLYLHQLICTGDSNEKHRSAGYALLDVKEIHFRRLYCLNETVTRYAVKFKIKSVWRADL